jgi:hypothetical protein
MRTWVLVSSLLLCAACTQEPAGPSLEIGTGDAEFEPLMDGDDAVVIQGPQGGFHLLGSLRATGIEPGDTDNVFDEDNPTMHFTVREDGERVDGSNAFIQGLDNAGRGVSEVVGRFVFLDIQADEQLVGSVVTLRMELTDVNGIALIDEVELNAVASPFNE